MTDQKNLFRRDASLAARQDKTDNLILPRVVRNRTEKTYFSKENLAAAHETIKKWAELETSGRLRRLNEEQLQGDFLAEVFGEVLGYTGPTEGAAVWHRLQHESFGLQTPDGILGRFTPGETPVPHAVVELKGPLVHLDRDRSNGRTAIDQCWDYLVNMDARCRWGVVSNIVSFRLYERGSTKRAYEHYTLQSLRDFKTFQNFYGTFGLHGLVEPGFKAKNPLAVEMLESSRNEQEAVGDRLYEIYSRHRTDLLIYLHKQLGHGVDDAVEMTQRLLDRVIFVAFCEDRELLPQETIARACKVTGFHDVTNPAWRQFKSLFRFIDAGSPPQYGIERYNGGLFATHAVDDLELPDTPWIDFFAQVAKFDFAAEVNLEVLGQFFERSITEIDRLKSTGLLGGDEDKLDAFARMPQSAKRKRLGVYYTPPSLTALVTKHTVEELITERFAFAAMAHGVDEDDALRGVTPDG
ncbi:MAG: hypothetical protein AAGJ97_10395, partial [Planctomycetota bacterium]